MEVEIVKFDNLGRGIGYINNKIIFIPKTVPGDIVNIEITLEKKNYYEGKVLSFIKESKQRILPKCPYYSKCGGCDLMHISLSNMLEYKLDKVNDILNNNNISYKVDNIVKSNNLYNYRNKVTLRIVNKIVGYYENDTHFLVEIKECLLCKDIINNVINDLYLLNIINGEITIRCNYKDEVLIIINSSDIISINEELINKYKIIGIIVNDKCLYGEDYFIDKIDNYLFRVSYDAFFQVNNYICSKLFELIKNNTVESKNILDFYCGVGTLGIVASNNNKKVLGVEINENAVKDAFINKCLNQVNNINFICADTKKVVDEIKSDFDTIILDPPRSGVDKNVLDKIIKENINKIIYVSCNPLTLVRDLIVLADYYRIVDITLLDMFPNTEHVEVVTILERI